MIDAVTKHKIISICGGLSFLCLVLAFKAAWLIYPAVALFFLWWFVLNIIL